MKLMKNLMMNSKMARTIQMELDKLLSTVGDAEKSVREDIKSEKRLTW